MSSAIDRRVLMVVCALSTACGSRSIEPDAGAAAETALSDTGADANDPRCPPVPDPADLRCTAGPYEFIVCQYPCGMVGFPARRVNTQCIDKRDGRGGQWRIVQTFYDCPWSK